MSVIIVDDQNTSVAHMGSWDLEGGQQEFNVTTSTSNSQGSFLQLTFYGSEINVYATVGGGDTTEMTFQVDSLSSTTYTANGNQPATLYHTLLFTQSSLSLGSPHTIVVSQSNAPTQSNLYIDYFLVAVPNTLNSTASNDLLDETILIDDASSQINYAGTWDVNAGTNQDLQGTLHGSGGSGSTATFSFDGTSIAVYGNIHNGSSGNLATFTIDGDAATGFTYAVPTSPAPNYYLDVSANTRMFSVGTLAAGNHTLLMSALGSNFFFDYALVTGFSPPNVSSSTTTTTSSTTTTSAANTSTVVGPTKKTNVAAIAGGVVGGVVGVIIVGLLIFFLLRRRRAPRGSGGAGVNPYQDSSAMGKTQANPQHSSSTPITQQPLGADAASPKPDPITPTSGGRRSP